MFKYSEFLKKKLGLPRGKKIPHPFLSGMGSVLDMGVDLPLTIRVHDADPEILDASAIGSDFAAIGHDIYRASSVIARAAAKDHTADIRRAVIEKYKIGVRAAVEDTTARILRAAEKDSYTGADFARQVQGAERTAEEVKSHLKGMRAKNPGNLSKEDKKDTNE